MVLPPKESFIDVLSEVSRVLAFHPGGKKLIEEIIGKLSKETTLSLREMAKKIPDDTKLSFFALFEHEPESPLLGDTHELHNRLWYSDYFPRVLDAPLLRAIVSASDPQDLQTRLESLMFMDGGNINTLIQAEQRRFSGLGEPAPGVLAQELSALLEKSSPAPLFNELKTAHQDTVSRNYGVASDLLDVLSMILSYCYSNGKYPSSSYALYQVPQPLLDYIKSTDSPPSLQGLIEFGLKLAFDYPDWKVADFLQANDSNQLSATLSMGNLTTLQMLVISKLQPTTEVA